MDPQTVHVLESGPRGDLAEGPGTTGADTAVKPLRLLGLWCLLRMVLGPHLGGRCRARGQDHLPSRKLVFGDPGQLLQLQSVLGAVCDLQRRIKATRQREGSGLPPGSRTDEAKRLLDSGAAGSWLRERTGHRGAGKAGVEERAGAGEALGFGPHRMF